MSRSTALCSKLKRGDISNPTPFQECRLLGNIQQFADSHQPLFVYINDLINCRTIGEYGGTLLLDDKGFPTNGNWQQVLEDGTFWIGLTPQTTNTPANPEGMKTQRWQPGDKVTCRMKSSDSTIPLYAANNCKISNAYKQGEYWFFTIEFTGLTPILRGTSGSTGFTELIIPSKGYTIQDCLGDRMLTDQMCDFYKQFHGLRLMEYQLTNTGSSDDTTPWRGLWSTVQQLSNFPFKSTQLKFYGVNGEKKITLGSSIHHLVKLVNEIKNRPGSNLQKIWINIPHEVCSVKTSNTIYSYDLDINSDRYVANTEKILAHNTVYKSLGEEYIYKTADYVCKNLHPSILTYWELSNEVWNSTFSTQTYFKNRQIEMVGNDEYGVPYNIKYDGGGPNSLYDGLRALAYYSCWMSDVVNKAFSDNNMPHKPRCLMGSWSSNISIAVKNPINYIEKALNRNVKDVFYGVATAPYVSPQGYINYNKTELYDKTVLHVESYINSNRAYTATDTGMKWITEYCRGKGIKHVAYELGVDYQNIPNSEAWRMVTLLEDSQLSYTLYYNFLKRFLSEVYDEVWYYSITPQPWWADYSNQFTIFPLGPLKEVGPSLAFKAIGNSIILPNNAITFPEIVGNSITAKTWMTSSKNDANTEMWNATTNPDTIFGNIYPNGTIIGSYKESPQLSYSVYVPANGTYELSMTGWGGYPLKQQRQGTSTFDTILTEGNINPSNLIIGNLYRIDAVGNTNWTAIGSVSNSQYTTFYATGVAPQGTTGIVSNGISSVPNAFASGQGGWVLSSNKYGTNTIINHPGKIRLNSILSSTTTAALRANPPPLDTSIQTTFERGIHTLTFKLDVPDLITGEFPGQILSIYSGIQSGNLPSVPNNAFNVATYFVGGNPNDIAIASSGFNTTSPTLNKDSGYLYTVHVTPGRTYQKNEGICCFLSNTDFSSTIFTETPALATDPSFGQFMCYDFYTFYHLRASATFTAYVKDYDPVTGKLDFYYAGYFSGTGGPYSKMYIKRCFVGYTNPGSWYSQNLSDITITIDPPDRSGGTQATAKVVSMNSNGGIAEIVVTNSGSGYSKPPNITVTDSSGAIPTREARLSAIIYGQNYSQGNYSFNYDFSSCIGGQSITYLTDATGNKVTINGAYQVLSYANNQLSWGTQKLNVKRIS